MLQTCILIISVFKREKNLESYMIMLNFVLKHCAGIMTTIVSPILIRSVKFEIKISLGFISWNTLTSSTRYAYTL